MEFYRTQKHVSFGAVFLDKANTGAFKARVGVENRAAPLTGDWINAQK